ncbi:hypothetical protein JCM10212_005595 [Sporobolomyces blumeae]
MASGATYNVTRFTRQVLKRHRRAPPSLVVHLYPTHFRFEHQHGNFAYDSPMKCFLEAIREQKLPTDLLDVLDDAKVVYYDGCLIVEVHDHRSTPPAPTQSLPRSSVFTFSVTPSARDYSSYNAAKAEVYRIVLAPNPATLWTELGIMSSRMEEEAGDADEENMGGTASSGIGTGLSEEQAVQMEAIILNRTMPPLCLDPSIQTSRIANSMLRATTLRPPKRKRFCGTGDCHGGEQGEEGSKREREDHERLMKVGDEGFPTTKGPAFSRLAFIQSYRERQNNPTGLTAQPGSAATSIRLGASSNQNSSSSTPNPQQQQQHQQMQLQAQQQAQAAAALAHSRTSRGASPAISVASNRTSHAKKPRSSNATPGPADHLSDGGASTMSGSTSTAAQHKKAKKLAQQAHTETNDPTLPLDPVERDKVLQERRKAASALKKQQSLKKKEKKRAEQHSQSHQADLQVGGSGGAGTPGKYGWTGA